MRPIPRIRPGRALLLWALLGAAGSASGAEPVPRATSLLLITLDTTRADYVGRLEGGSPVSPNLDALARRGTRYTRAVTSSPLTLPAHCSLLTGKTPAQHGVRDNGVGALPRDVPTLAEALAARGYATGAFVSSRVLDRRFGLDRGFRTYDDQMVAERIGEQGYPERDAQAVTGSALAWVASLPAGRPYFLWVHYYDPHAPYQPPGDWTGRSAARRYAGEVSYMDSEIGRLLRALPRAEPGGSPLVAAVGDHGEMLGEHGEQEHGVFLYAGSLAVPLILAGPGVPAGGVVREVVGTRALPATILALLGVPDPGDSFGGALPGAGAPRAAAGPEPVYSETFLPADSYGWSPLAAVTDGRWRFISAPRPELYDLVGDPGETRNRISEEPEQAARLRRLLETARAEARAPDAPPSDPELAASLRSLGYLSGSSPRRSGGLDPKTGIGLLREFEEAKRLRREGKTDEAVAAFAGLVRRSPGNVPFLMRLGDAQLAAGLAEPGIQSLIRAVALSPALDFLRVRLAQAYAELGRPVEARSEYRAALELNPRSAPAWSGLAEIARRAEGPSGERRVLEACDAAGTRSATLLTRLAVVELALGDAAASRGHAERALRLAAELPEGSEVEKEARRLLQAAR